MFDPGLFLFGPTAPFFTAFGIDPSEFVKVAHSPLKLLDGGAIVAYPFDAHEQRRLLRDWRSVASLARGRLAQ